MTPHPRIEALEARIAPANFFLSGAAADLVVRDSTGAPVAGDAAAATAVGAGLAIPLVKGDVLILDADADHQLDTGETKLASVTEGRALVFITDIGGSVATVTTPIGAASDIAQSVAVQKDGKIVVAGFALNGAADNDFAVVRYNRNGTLDTTFNGTGKVVTPIGSGTSDEAYALALQSDGKILVAGKAVTGGNADFALVRYNSDGSLDTSFNTTGKVTTPIGSGDDIANGVAVQSDGKIVLAGSFFNGTDDDFAVVRYTASGILDTAFNGTGKATTAIGTGADIANGLAVQSDGKIVLAGSAFNGTDNDFAVVRYTAAGILDTAFNTTGKVTTAVGTAADIAHSVVVQSDGRIVLAGASSNGADNDFAAVRYTTAGALDTTFNTTGKVTTPIGLGEDIAEGVIVQSDGRIVLAGSSFGVGGDDFALVRYTATGALDATFNDTGKVTTAIGIGADTGHTVALQSDGRLVVAGSALIGATDDFAIARYNGSGVLDQTFLFGGAPNTRFEPGDITGLAVSDAFQARINSDINGSIITALDANGVFKIADRTPTVGDPSDKIVTVQTASIDALNINGQVVGNIFAGGDITNVKITTSYSNAGADGRSVTGNIATGTAMNESASQLKAPALSLNGGGKALTLATFATSSSARGGDISDVQLEHGAKNLLAGNGDDNDLAAPGRGGSISRVAMTIDSAVPAWIRAGKGGTSNTGAGARGGSVDAVTVKLTADATDSLRLIGGDGGRGSGTGNGGAGGAIIDSTVTAIASIATSSLEVTAGLGGKAEGTGAGGAGGAITSTTVQLLGAAKTVKTLKVAAGVGGDSAGGAGGAGGSLVDFTLLAEAIVGDGTAGSAFEVAGGNGGAGTTRGGAGGGISGGDIFLRGDVKAPQAASIHAGAGGALKANATAKSIAGKGGAISALDVAQFADVTAGITLASGDGGSAAAAANGRGGAGGALTASIIGQGGANTALVVQAGAGGAAPTSSGNGGAGGGIAKTSISEFGALKSLTVQAGNGADANGFGTGGAAGAIKTLRVVTGAVTGQVKLLAGAGGKSAGSKGSAGGVVSALQFQNLGTLFAGIQIVGGAGGAAMGDAAGGAGGAIIDSTLTNVGGTNGLTLVSGTGGSGGGAGGGAGGGIARFTLESFASLGTGAATITSGAGGNRGGAGGKISSLKLHTLESKLVITAGAGGTSSRSNAGGAGGSIDGVSGAVDTATFIAGNGGNNTDGAGGAGGAIRHIDLDVVGTFVRALIAGNGGDGATTAGAGGSVSSVSVAGDIGDFAHNFDLAGANGMGGIAAGQAGKVAGNVVVKKNGSIASITATRIAAMIAGTPAANAVGSANAVLKISKITAGVIGADVNGDGDFDPAGFTIGGVVAAEDGFILVRAGGLTLPATLVPLKTFTV